ncbi:putative short-chain dehydrogenase/reductase [Mycolicibacterium phlei]|uniref:SDR family NAD(P)-dependent oxidoreductase n=1 Tax=Mycobacteroides chelonae TaxID=1774 RepID=UPI000618A4C3|nr:SDR family NAD(P)-dependent oxidoreductase [Mycobacteroides chelonae]VEG18809.1 putative short-chain dehydrogenase/reductase [Mycolicibacterium phlei]AKC39849.1 short-chain dehydrogenase [Mycobacteroides chelonae]ANA99411.1 short-chain dehydrogenase [Mycobacteroides chelonae CCUG 47445]OLT82760.1 short-chain dehydrogenase [Mycobacteroides chelonae]ORV16327.1 short-chain dehydrogenase [Mycobacteroides chelonae]
MATYPDRPIAGSRIVITGATNGIGKEIARALVRRGALLTLVARDPVKAADTIRELAAENGAITAPEYIQADLADLDSVRAAAREIAATHPRIDTLVNNAGIHSLSSKPSVDGFDLMTATNHLGPFLLTNLLLEPIIAADHARIVITASEAHRSWPRINLDRFAEPRSYNAIGSEVRYGQSKLMNILFTQELARRLEGSGVTVNCFCPGMVSTGLVRDSRILTAAAGLAARTPFVRRPDQGARMGIRLVLDDNLATISGQFFTSTPGLGVLPAVRIRSNQHAQEELWQRSRELVNL